MDPAPSHAVSFIGRLDAETDNSNISNQNALKFQMFIARFLVEPTTAVFSSIG